MEVETRIWRKRVVRWGNKNKFEIVWRWSFGPLSMEVEGGNREIYKFGEHGNGLVMVTIGSRKRVRRNEENGITAPGNMEF